MQTITRWFIKTAIIHMILALSFGVLYASNFMSGVGGPNWHLAMMHSLGIGWLTNLIMGVSIWMFPRYSKEEPLGNMKIWWLAYGIIQVGLIFRIIAEILPYSSSFYPFIIWIASFGLLVGFSFYAVGIWQRVKPKRSR